MRSCKSTGTGKPPVARGDAREAWVTLGDMPWMEVTWAGWGGDTTGLGCCVIGNARGCVDFGGIVWRRGAG